ncbi:MAG: SDR family oxidoreductase [Kouleothrix sp.]
MACRFFGLQRLEACAGGATRSLALEATRYGITANALCPGWVETDMVRDTVANIREKTGRSDAEARASILALYPASNIRPKRLLPRLCGWLARWRWRERRS